MTNYAVILPSVGVIDTPDVRAPLVGSLDTWESVARFIGREGIDILLVHTWLPGAMPDVWAGTDVGPTGWLTITIKEPVRRHMHLCILDRAGNDAVIGDLAVRPNKGSEFVGRILDRLNMWEGKLGAPYHTKPSVAALTAMRANAPAQPLAPGRRIRWKLQHPASAEWWQPPANIVDMRYRWKGLDYLLPDVAVQCFDMRSAYLAAAAQVVLPYGQLVHDDGGPEECGYYRVRADEASRAFMAMMGEPDTAGTYWVTHATLALLREIGTPIEVVEAWIATGRTGRILRPWAERWRDAIATWPGMRQPLKDGYTQALGGLLNVRRGTIYRPDWRHMIIDQVRASLLRRILAAGEAMWPCKIDVDSVYYTTDLDTPFGDAGEWLKAKLGVGDRIGNMRYVGQTTVGHIR